jgi:hypothetical protein
MQSEYLRPEALKEEFRSKYEGFKDVFEKIVLPSENKPKKLEDFAIQQGVVVLFAITWGRKILRNIKESGGGSNEDTFDTTMGNLFSLEQQMNKLIIMAQIMEMVDMHDPLYIELIGAKDALYQSAYQLTNRVVDQVSGYDKLNNYQLTRARWKSELRNTLKWVDKLGKTSP